MKTIFFTVVVFFSIILAKGQGFDSIYVEKIPVSQQAIAEDPNLNLNSVTYRVFVCMKPGYSLATVQGTFANPLLFKTTTKFYNHDDGEVIPLFRPIPKMTEALYYDSWITIGQYSRMTSASQLVPLSEDTDGVKDGIMLGAVTNATQLDPATNFEIIWGYEMGLNADFNTPGYDPENVIWYAAGGVSGVGPSNSVCIGQFTTDGQFSMDLGFRIVHEVKDSRVFIVREKIESDQILTNKIIFPPNKKPSVQLTGPANGSVYKMGEKVNISAIASDIDGTIASLSFFVNGNMWGTFTDGPYVVEYTVDRKGSIPIYAVTVDDRFGRDTTGVINIFSTLQPNVKLISPQSNATYEMGQKVAIEANAQSPDGQIVKVEFYINDQLISTVTGAPYRMEWTADVVGTRLIQAKVYDNLNGVALSGVVSINVNAAGNKPPVVNIVSPEDGLVVLINQTITLKASVRDDDPGDLISKVEFFSNDIKIGEALTAPFDFVWSNAISGSMKIKAKATDNRGGSSFSPEITITYNIPPFVAITLPLSGASILTETIFSIFASSTDADGTITKVALFVDDIYKGDFVRNAGNNYSISLKIDEPGMKTFKAVATDNHNAFFSSEPISITFTPVGTHFVKAPENKTVWAYPNPANDFVTIRFSDTMEGTSVRCQMLDALGRVALLKDFNNLSAGENSIQIDLTQLPSGIYFLKTSNTEGSKSEVIRILKKDNK